MICIRLLFAMSDFSGPSGSTRDLRAASEQLRVSSKGICDVFISVILFPRMLSRSRLRRDRAAVGR